LLLQVLQGATANGSILVKMSGAAKRASSTLGANRDTSESGLQDELAGQIIQLLFCLGLAQSVSIDLLRGRTAFAFHRVEALKWEAASMTMFSRVCFKC
jgi:hypothetical protein